MVPRVKNFVGYISQLRFNGVDYFDRMKSGLLSKEFAMTATFSHVDDIIFNDVSFKNQLTYLGLPQMKAYTDISISFRFKTLEMNGTNNFLANVLCLTCRVMLFTGLIMYNAGKGQDFIAVELVNGHIHYIFNLGYGSISIKDNCPRNLNDNQWHSVTVGRPSKFRHTLLVDSHLALANSRYI